MTCLLPLLLQLHHHHCNSMLVVVIVIQEQFGPINFIMVLRGLQSEVDIQAIAVIKRLRESRSITTIMEHFQTIADGSNINSNIL